MIVINIETCRTKINFSEVPAEIDPGSNIEYLILPAKQIFAYFLFFFSDQVDNVTIRNNVHNRRKLILIYSSITGKSP